MDTEITVDVGEQNLFARIVVLDQHGNPMPSPATPAWTSLNRDAILPHPVPDGLSAHLEVVGPGDARLLVETGLPGGNIIRGSAIVHVVDRVPTSVAIAFEFSA